MRILAWDDFADAVGTAFAVEAGGARHLLTLAAAEPLADSGREGGAFRLEFRGPADPILPQATYAFAGGDGDPLEIFIVPIARDENGTRYEAIFYGPRAPAGAQGHPPTSPP